mgnify:FL=1
MNTKLLPLLSLLLLTACVSNKELTNFQSGENWDSVPKEIPQQPALVIQPDDVLSITVHSFDMAAAAPYNTDFNLTAAQGSVASIATPGGCLVGPDGYIDFPVIGRIMLGGLTVEQAKNTVQKLVAKQLVDPVVMVRFLNFRITVIGEVSNPATFTIPNQKINILEAIGLAGDLTPYGKRDNILVIREQNGKREFGHINLKDKSIFSSPFFYLAQNDVIYIEPIKEKANTISERSTKILPWLSIAVTTLTLLATLLK